MKQNYYLAVIQAAVANNDFEFNAEDSIMDVFQQAYDNLMDEPVGKTFVHTELNFSGMSMNYTFCDEDTDFQRHVTSEQFDFLWKYKAKDEVLFRDKGNGEFEPVDWFEVPVDGEPDRDKYIFVFDKEILSDGRLAMLYDYFE